MQITPVLLYIGGTGENIQPQVRCRRLLPACEGALAMMLILLAL